MKNKIVLWIALLFGLHHALCAEILCTSDEKGNWDMVIYNQDGEILKRLAPHSSDDYCPTYSPIHKKVLFGSNRDNESRNLFQIDPDTHLIIQLTALPSRDGHADWSDDGTKIAFQSRRDGNPEVYIMNSDGTAPRRITHSGGFDGTPRWSPCGTQLTFNTSRHGSPDVYIYDLIKEKETRLTNDKAKDYTGDWSPDGKSILFSSDRLGHFQIYTMNWDGSNQTPVIRTPFPLANPSYDASGKFIACSGFKDGNWDIFIITVDGSHIQQVTRTAFNERGPIILDQAPIRLK